MLFAQLLTCFNIVYRRWPGTTSYNLSLALCVGLVMIPGCLLGLHWWSRATSDPKWPTLWSPSLFAAIFTSSLAPFAAKLACVLATPTAIIGEAANLLAWLLFGLAVGALTTSLTSRPDNRLRCAKCDYELEEADYTAYDRCSECGTTLGAPKSLSIGRRAPARRLSLAAVICFALCPTVLIVGQKVDITFRILQALPTTTLIRMSLGSTPSQMSELALSIAQNRPLSKVEESYAIDQAISLSDHAPSDFQNRTFFSDLWMSRLLAEGAFTQSQLDRAFAGRVRVYLQTGNRPNVGHSCRLIARADEQPRIGKHRCRPSIYLAGYRAPPSYELQGRETFAAYIENGDLTTRGQGRRQRMSFDFTPGTPGLTTIEAEGWIAFDSGDFSRNPITWNPDGTPAFPSTVIWSEPFKASLTINVEP